VKGWTWGQPQRQGRRFGAPGGGASSSPAALGTLFMVLAVAASPIRAQDAAPQQQEDGALDARPEWVLLAPWEAFGWAENRNRMSQLCSARERPEGESQAACFNRILQPRVWSLPLHEGPDATSTSRGSLLIVATPGEPVRPLILAKGEAEAVPFVPDLYDPDFGYGPWFHQTLLAEKDGWYLLPFGPPLAGRAWLELRRIDERPEIFPLQSERIYWASGRLAERPAIASPVGATVVVSVDEDAVLLRPERPADMACGEEVPADDGEEPAPVRVPFHELYDEAGHLLLRIRYTRGC